MQTLIHAHLLIQLLSKGELKRPKAKSRPNNDPFDKFLSKLYVSSPEDTSTPTTSRVDDDTLSEVPSISASAPPFQPQHRKHDGACLAVPRHQTPKLTVPYHKQFVLKQRAPSSPGEIPMQHSHKPHDSFGEHTLSYSEGEAPRILVKGERATAREVGVPVIHSAPSPGELRLSNKTRGGIDVINVSKISQSVSLLHSGPHPLPDGSPSPPHQTISVNGDSDVHIAADSTGKGTSGRTPIRVRQNLIPSSGSRLVITDSVPTASIVTGGRAQLIQVQSLSKGKPPSSPESTSSLGARTGLPPRTDSMAKKHDLHLSDLTTEELDKPPTHSRNWSESSSKRVPGATVLVGREGRRPVLSVTVPTAEGVERSSLSLSGEDEDTNAPSSTEFEFSPPSLPGLD